MRIGELSRRTGLSQSRIRYYERIGLLRAVERLPNGYRVYPENAVIIIGLILLAQDAGFTLEEMQMLVPRDLAVWDHDLLTATLSRKITEIEIAQARLAASKAHLLAISEALSSRPDGMDCASNAERVMSLAMLGRAHMVQRGGHAAAAADM
ncbi:MerR family DNA-binding transcriptional regulator [Paracoccus sp. S1E-3]|uniref:MerR family DNA-binding transcriptional regulator n=1 Tax=Paracoccus sp. S1E-3 TaxID=2756130 RepID=UPI0015EF84DA|nr:MerR family DNA-binding transcriptional regulator [Paracoccus sp. S1E-3]MBA4491757.1 MerR family DNA-binding transcriptional regulator [Paracoccus sp. S1E-3]